jgi:hypothetical protein
LASTISVDLGCLDRYSETEHQHMADILLHLKLLRVLGANWVQGSSAADAWWASRRITANLAGRDPRPTLERAAEWQHEAQAPGARRPRALRQARGVSSIVWRMGLREWAAKAPVATFGVRDQVALYKDSVKRGAERFPLEGVSSRVEAGSDLETRVTATRLIALGIFAFAAKKKRGGEVFLTVEGPEFFWTIEVDRKDQSKAREFAAKVTNQARSV